MGNKKQKRTVVDFMGCKNLSAQHKKVWKILFDRVIVSTKFVDTFATQLLGIEGAVEELLDRVGLGAFCDRKAPTFRRFTLEFLSTLEIHRDDDPPRITFHLDGEERELTFDELREIFGIDEKADGEFKKLSPQELEIFWKALKGGDGFRTAGEKNADIPHPALRYIHRVLSATFLCKGEQTHLPKSDLNYLWALMPDSDSHPDWLEIFLSGCEKHQTAASGNIPLGGMVTLLARHFKIKDPDDMITGEISVGVEFMRSCDMIVYVHDIAGYVWTLGTDHRHYLRLPRGEEGRPLPLGPTPSHFYIPRDVAHKGGSTNIANRQLPPVPSIVETVGQSSSSDFEKWGDWREMMEDMQGESLDNSRLCAEMSRCVNRFYLKKFPREYEEPSPEFYAQLDANAKARLARKAAREARSRGATSSSHS